MIFMQFNNNDNNLYHKILNKYLNVGGAFPPVKLYDGGVLGSNVGVLLGGLKLNPVDGAEAGACKKLYI